MLADSKSDELKEECTHSVDPHSGSNSPAARTIRCAESNTEITSIIIYEISSAPMPDRLFVCLLFARLGATPLRNARLRTAGGASGAVDASMARSHVS